MPQIQTLNKTEDFTIRIKPGEKLMATLEEIMRDRQYGYVTFQIPTGGGLVDIEGSFSVGHKTGSITHKFAGPMELGGGGGNIAWDYDDPSTPMVHCHVGLGNEKKLEAYIAHLVEATVMLTAEIKAEAYKEKILRKLDEKVNLKLLDLPEYLPGQPNPCYPEGTSQGLKEEIERLKKELAEVKKKNQDLSKLNNELSETNAELSKRLVKAEISVSPKG